MNSFPQHRCLKRRRRASKSVNASRTQVRNIDQASRSVGLLFVIESWLRQGPLKFLRGQGICDFSLLAPVFGIEFAATGSIIKPHNSILSCSTNAILNIRWSHTMAEFFPFFDLEPSSGVFCILAKELEIISVGIISSFPFNMRSPVADFPMLRKLFVPTNRRRVDRSCEFRWSPAHVLGSPTSLLLPRYAIFVHIVRECVVLEIPRRSKRLSNLYSVSCGYQ
jgi:hypothetical protein